MTTLHPLAKAIEHPAPKRAVLSPWRVIIGLFLAPSAFSVQVMAGYVVAALGCDAGAEPRFMLYVIVIVAMAAMVAGLLVALANFRATRDEGTGDHMAVQDRGDGRTRFLAYLGLCASSVFALAALVQLSSIVTLARCVGFPPSS